MSGVIAPWSRLRAALSLPLALSSAILYSLYATSARLDDLIQYGSLRRRSWMPVPPLWHVYKCMALSVREAAREVVAGRSR